jgi:hypothetical protein
MESRCNGCGPSGGCVVPNGCDDFHPEKQPEGPELRLECQIHTLPEVVEILRESKGLIILSSDRSKQMLANWLEELHKARKGIYDAKVALAQTDSPY